MSATYALRKQKIFMQTSENYIDEMKELFARHAVQHSQFVQKILTICGHNPSKDMNNVYDQVLIVCTQWIENVHQTKTDLIAYCDYLSNLAWKSYLNVKNKQITGTKLNTAKHKSISKVLTVEESHFSEEEQSEENATGRPKTQGLTVESSYAEDEQLEANAESGNHEKMGDWLSQSSRQTFDHSHQFDQPYHLSQGIQQKKDDLDQLSGHKLDGWPKISQHDSDGISQLSKQEMDQLSQPQTRTNPMSFEGCQPNILDDPCNDDDNDHLDQLSRQERDELSQLSRQLLDQQQTRTFPITVEGCQPSTQDDTCNDDDDDDDDDDDLPETSDEDLEELHDGDTDWLPPDKCQPSKRNPKSETKSCNKLLKQTDRPNPKRQPRKRKGEKPPRCRGKGFICEFCAKKYRSRRQLETHVRTHTGDKPFECSACDFKTHDEINLNKHWKTIHLGEKPFHCDQCDYKTYSKTHLKNHQLTHRQDRNFICEICHSAFKNLKSLTHHKERHNVLRKHISCPECGKIYLNKHSLYRHRKRAHTDNPVMYPCEVCGKKFNQRSNLTVHMRSHNDERRFLCDNCGRGFVHKVSLTGHMQGCLKRNNSENIQRFSSEQRNHSENLQLFSAELDGHAENDQVIPVEQRNLFGNFE